VRQRTEAQRDLAYLPRESHRVRNFDAEEFNGDNFHNQTRGTIMRYSILFAALIAALGLSACEKATVITPAPAVVTVPGPAGPQGATGAVGEVTKGDTGATGNTGAPGDTGAKGSTGTEGAQGERGEKGSETVVIVPVK
jgi:hypothetical protein